MKIGLIGNMNNNNFAFLRYLIDLGYDAKLIVFKNETSGNSSHFSPEADSWQFEKWNKYIVQCELNEDPVSIFNFPVSYFFGLKTIIENLFNRINSIKKLSCATFCEKFIIKNISTTKSISNIINPKINT